MNALKLGIAAALGLSVLATGAEAAPDVTLGFDPTAELEGAVRYRNLGNVSGGATKEIFIGIPPLAVVTAATATQAVGDVSWGTGKTITFKYDPVTGKLITTVSTSPSPLVTSQDVGNLGTLNYLEITITKNTPSTAVSFNSVSLQTPLSTDSLSSFTGIDGTRRWKVTGIDLTSGFTVTGTLALTGVVGGNDSNLVQIDAGYVAPSDADGPVTSDVDVNPKPVIIEGQGTVTATVDDSTTGGNTIKSAEYSLNGGPWTAMAAQDGTFNAVSEDVEATFDATELGENEVCARGTDSLDNVGADICQSFLVTYKFDGFFSPIDNGLLNIAKAGQAIPAKWRLTDADGLPIEYPESFVGLYTSPSFNCTDFAALQNDQVEEYAAGSSGLQYLGDGYWQFNWKTDKNYANTCRAMYLEFDSGATSPVAKVQFKK